MSIFKKILAFMDDSSHFIMLVNVILCVASLFLFYELFPLWRQLIAFAWVIIKPFLLAFALAYILDPVISWLENLGMKRTFAIAIVVGMFILMLLIVVGTLLPMLYSSLQDLVGPLTDGLNEIATFLDKHFHLDIYVIASQISDTITQWLSEFSFLNTVTGIISYTVEKIGSYLFYGILAIYFMVDYKAIRNGIKRLIHDISGDLYYCVKQVDAYLITYFQTFLLLMVIQMVMYGFVYLVVGHPNWLLLGILSGLSCIFPYIGPMIVNVVGFLTALNLPFFNIVMLLVLMFVQSNLDSYFITPKVYSTRIKIEPVLVLFAILTGSTLFGAWGVVIAMPVLMIIKVGWQSYRQLKKT